MKEPPGDTHSDGSFIVCEKEIGQKMGRKSAKMPENPKNEKNQHDNSIKITVLIWSERQGNFAPLRDTFGMRTCFCYAKQF